MSVSTPSVAWDPSATRMRLPVASFAVPLALLLVFSFSISRLTHQEPEARGSK